MSLAKNSMVVYEDHKNASPFYECFSNVQHGFMKALKNVHLPFMSLSKICITIYEGHKKCISFVRAHQQGASRFYEGGKKCASPFYESFKNAHLDLWRPHASATATHGSLAVSLHGWAIRIMSFVPNAENSLHTRKWHPRFWPTAKCRLPKERGLSALPPPHNYT